MANAVEQELVEEKNKDLKELVKREYKEGFARRKTNLNSCLNIG